MQHYSVGENTEEAMIALLRRNDQQSFFELYEHYAPMLFGIVEGITKNKETAEKVLQSCFKQIWSGRHDFNASAGSLFSWMYNITKNLALQSRTPSEKINFDQAAEEALALPLIVIHGCSFQEIAGQMNVSVENLKLSVRTAFQKVKTSVLQ